MKSHAAIRNHPIHPMLVSLPIGGFVAALLADAIYLTVGRSFWYDVAYWAIAFGIVTALLAAIPGVIDYRTSVQASRPARPIARMHMLINTGVVGVYAVNLYLRGRYGASLGGGMLALAVGLNVLSFVALGVSGWLGGELVYRYGIGVPREGLRIAMLESEREEARR